MALYSRQLLAFIAVAEELHFGRAARRLHVSQPPLSQQVRQFEEWAGAQLIDRTTRTVRLTPAGQVMLEAMQRVMADAQAAIDATRRVAAGQAGFLRVGFTTTAAYRLVPAVVGPYRGQYPGIHLVMEERTSSDLLEDLLRDRIDVALMRKHEELSESGLTFEEVDREDLVVALPHDHPLAKRRQIPVAQLQSTDLIGFARSTSQYFHALLEELFFRNDIKPRYVMESLLPTILALVESGIGIAIVPASVRELRPKGVAYRPLDAVNAMQSVIYAVHRSQSPNPAVPGFLAMVRAVRDA
jgi:DNA-binding transcriptional LysR family regulator